MNDFVEQCLREWERVGVANAVANEMAADLDADLREAAAEGVAPEEVLGNNIFDAPAFARTWAAARGVIPPTHVPTRHSKPRRITALALGVLAVLGTALLALVIVHPTARVVTMHRSAFSGSTSGPRTPFGFPPSSAVVQHPGIGAPPGLIVFGLLLIALLAGGAWLAGRRA